MPRDWVPPGVALEHSGRTVYHAYKGDDIENCLTYAFNTDFAEGEEFEFDVRELKAWQGIAKLRKQFGALLGDLQQVIRQAIDDGEIVFPDNSSVTIYVLDDGETYGGGAFVVDVSPEQHERIIEGEKVCDVVLDWDRRPLTREDEND